MTSFKHIVQSVHDAALAANDALRDSQLEHLSRFFTDAKGEDFNVETINSQKPRVVVIQYPRRTENGVEMVDIAVPLFTIVPLNMLQVEQVKLRAQLKLQLVDDELQTEFVDNSDSISWASAVDAQNDMSEATAEVEIILRTNSDQTELQELISKCERELRAQISG